MRGRPATAVAAVALLALTMGCEAETAATPEPTAQAAPETQAPPTTAATPSTTEDAPAAPAVETPAAPTDPVPAVSVTDDTITVEGRASAYATMIRRLATADFPARAPDAPPARLRIDVTYLDGTEMPVAVRRATLPLLADVPVRYEVLEDPTADPAGCDADLGRVRLGGLTWSDDGVVRAAAEITADCGETAVRTYTFAPMLGSETLTLVGRA